MEGDLSAALDQELDCLGVLLDALAGHEEGLAHIHAHACAHDPRDGDAQPLANERLAMHHGVGEFGIVVVEAAVGVHVPSDGDGAPGAMGLRNRILNLWDRS